MNLLIWTQKRFALTLNMEQATLIKSRYAKQNKKNINDIHLLNSKLNNNIFKNKITIINQSTIQADVLEQQEKMHKENVNYCSVCNTSIIDAPKQQQGIMGFVVLVMNGCAV